MAPVSMNQLSAPPNSEPAVSPMRRWIWFLAGLAALLLSGFGFWKLNTRSTLVQVDAELPDDFPEHGFAHNAFERLLVKYVVAGRVDYDAWQRDNVARAQLDSYLAAVAAYSPDSHPARFSGDNDGLAYWMYAYNAFVIKAILERWPLDSVTDVKAPVEVVKGLGFFYTLKFVAGGKAITLYDLEHNKVLRPASDPRVHFVLNCGSAGCPVIRPKLPTGAELETLMEQAAADFVNEPRNVSVDHAAKEIRLSTIFEWYKDDFLNELRRRGLPTKRGVVAYVELVAGDKLRADLEKGSGYKVRHVPYDWDINAAK